MIENTIELSDYQIERLYSGFSVRVDKTLITFSDESKRNAYNKIKEVA